MECPGRDCDQCCRLAAASKAAKSHLDCQAQASGGGAMILPVAFLVATMALHVRQRPIEIIQDRPVTWDWHGTLPLISLDGQPDPILDKWLRDMRAGEYYAAYVSAKGDLKKN